MDSAQSSPLLTDAPGMAPHRAANPRLYAMDSFRGIGATLVVIFHVDLWSDFHTTHFFRNIMSNMEFFFILSGFVMAMGFYGSLTKSGSVTGYLVRRIGRLWPLHAVTLFVLVGLESAKGVWQALGYDGGEHPVFTGSKSVAALVANLLMLHGWGFYKTPTWNYPGWSISAEFAAYLAFAIFCLARPSRPILAGLAFSAVAITGLFFFSPHGMDGHADFGLLRCLAGFFIGVAMQRFMVHLNRKGPFRLPCPTVLEALALGIVCVYMLFQFDGLESFLDVPIYSFFCFIFILEQGRIAGALNNRVLQTLGKWSYSIYMVHAPLISVAHFMIDRAIAHIKPAISPYQPYVDEGYTEILLRIASPAVSDVIVIAYVGLVIALAGFTFKYVEEPARLWSQQVAKAIEARKMRRTSSPVRSLP